MNELFGGSTPSLGACPVDGIGIHTCLRNKVLQVRVLYRAFHWTQWKGVCKIVQFYKPLKYCKWFNSLTLGRLQYFTNAPVVKLVNTVDSKSTTSVCRFESDWGHWILYPNICRIGLMVRQEIPNLLMWVRFLHPVPNVFLTQWTRVLGYEPRSRRFKSYRRRLTISYR